LSCSATSLFAFGLELRGFSDRSVDIKGLISTFWLLSRDCGVVVTIGIALIALDHQL
jgi:hypothetical protein